MSLVKVCSGACYEDLLLFRLANDYCHTHTHTHTQHVDEAKRHYSEVFQEGKLPLAMPRNDLSDTVLREGDLATAEAIKK